VSSNLIYYLLLLIPPIRSSASARYIILITLILFVSKVMPSCSYYIKKGLVYIIIAALSSHQPLSCAKYIKVNICSSYNVYSLSNAKYIYYPTLLSCLVPCLSYYKVLNSICCKRNWKTSSLPPIANSYTFVPKRSWPVRRSVSYLMLVSWPSLGYPILRRFMRRST